MSDVICYDDLDEFGRDINDPLTELEQDIVHLLLEAPGSNCDAPDRSVGLDDALNGQIDPSLRHRIEQKLMDDPRITAASATFEALNDSKVKITVQIQVNEEELGVAIVVDAAGNVSRAS